MKTFNRTAQSFSVPMRETINGKYAANKCGRDFLYLALHFYHPAVFSAETLNPQDIDRQGLLGTPVPAWLSWTQVQFKRTAEFLGRYGLTLRINDHKISGYWSFVCAILFSRKDVDIALSQIYAAIDAGKVAGIDISLGLGGLLDHVLFVYGYDDENLYVFDTHTILGLEYIQTTIRPQLYKLPNNIIRSRWTRFGRVWTVTYAQSTQ